MRRERKTALVGILVALTLPGCAAKRPVLYPNEQLSRVGQAVADRDIDACMQHAQSFQGAGAHEPAKNTVAGGAAGAAVGAVGGAITGNAGEGAAVGAATGATAGLLHSLWAGGEHDPVYENFVDRCLREKGYDPIGWR